MEAGRHKLKPWDEVPAPDVRRQLQAIIDSPIFARADRMRRFLSFIVGQTLKGKAHSIKEYSIAVEVYDKEESFDSRLDPIVRVEAGRLRAKLREYYEKKGRQDPVRISLPKRTYVPVFRWQDLSPHHRRANSAPAADESKAGPTEASVPFRGVPSITVLPFSDLSAAQDQAYFCDGLTDEVTHALNGFEAVQVVSRTLQPNPSGVQKSHGTANIVLEGSVRKRGKKRRITALLIEAENGRHVWSFSSDYETENIFAVQESVAAAVIEALKSNSTGPSRKPVSERGTKKPEAYELYLQGRYCWNHRNEKMLFKAIDFLERAVQLDRKYALAYAGVADAYASLLWLGAIRPKEAWNRGYQAARKALAFNNSLSQAHASIGFLTAVYQRKWDKAEVEFQRAAALDPCSATVHHWYAVFCLAPRRRLKQAWARIQKARDLDPLSPAINAHLGWILYLRRQFSEAIEQLQKTIQLAPNFYLPRWQLGFTFVQTGAFQEALTSFREAEALESGQPAALAGLGYCYGLMGDRPAALKILHQLKRLARRRYVSALDLSLVHLGLAESDPAFEWLEKACQDRCSRLVHLQVDPAFDHLKQDSRFRHFMDQLSLNP